MNVMVVVVKVQYLTVSVKKNYDREKTDFLEVILLAKALIAVPK